MFLLVGLFEVFLTFYEVTFVKRAQQTLEQATEFRYMYMLKIERRGRAISPSVVVRLFARLACHGSTSERNFIRLVLSRETDSGLN